MGKREDNKRQKHQALLRAGLKTFTTDGYDRASIETIVREAGVARGTFYLYFDDKLSLFSALVTPWTQALGVLIEQVDRGISTANTAPELERIYETMAMHVALLGMQHQAVILLAFRGLRTATEAGVFLREEEDRLLDDVTRITAHAAERGLIQIRNPAVVARMVLGSVERLTFDVLTGRDLGPPLEVAAEVVQLFSRSLLQQPSGGEQPNSG